MPLWVPVCEACSTAIRGSFALRLPEDPSEAETTEHHGQRIPCRACGSLEELGPTTAWEDVG